MSLGPTLEKDMAPDGDSSHRLTELTAEATLKYAMKDYNTAAELYSQAMEMQAEINGEMSSDNSDLLYNYGRCLYHVAVQNSDVLGSRMANEKSDGRKKLPRQKRVAKPKPDDDETKPIIEEVITGIIEEKQSSGKPLKEVGNTSTPYFQITGDENFNTSDEEAGREELEGESEDTDEEDDFANAFEVLDLARILLLKKIEEDEANSEKSNTKSRTLRVQELQERLADTYDLQAEISLEGERYPNAVVDLSSALDLKRSLFPPDSSVIAEAHFKLSLALEFSSVTQQRNSDEGIPEARASHVDYAMREEAGKEMEAAIASCKLRIQKEESKLQDITQSNRSDAASKEVKTNIDEVKDMVGEMEQRLSELRQPPVSIHDSKISGAIDGSNPLAGILGSMLGEPSDVQKARLEQATEGANDLTRYVKKKKPAEERQSTTQTLENSRAPKRNAEILGRDRNLDDLKKAKHMDGDNR